MPEELEDNKWVIKNRKLKKDRYVLLNFITGSEIFSAICVFNSSLQI
jgi:hypothetical protein